MAESWTVGKNCYRPHADDKYFISLFRDGTSTKVPIEFEHASELIKKFKLHETPSMEPDQLLYVPGEEEV